MQYLHKASLPSHPRTWLSHIRSDPRLSRRAPLFSSLSLFRAPSKPFYPTPRYLVMSLMRYNPLSWSLRRITLPHRLSKASTVILLRWMYQYSGHMTPLPSLPTRIWHLNTPAASTSIPLQVFASTSSGIVAHSGAPDISPSFSPITIPDHMPPAESDPFSASSPSQLTKHSQPLPFL